ncbi:hypothetical protein NDU88_002125, partial [Pleurodeles waltl]
PDNAGQAYLNHCISFHTPAKFLCSGQMALASVPRIRQTTAGGRSFYLHCSEEFEQTPPAPQTKPVARHLQKGPQDLALRMRPPSPKALRPSQVSSCALQILT